MGKTLDADTINSAGRMKMIEGYKKTPAGSPSSKHFKEAEKLFKKAHEVDPNNSHYTLNIADALFALNRLDEANKYYHESLSGLGYGSDHLKGVKRRWGVYITGTL